MTADQLQAALDARPFRPFTIYPVANSCAFITHPRNVWCSQTGNLVVIELLVNEIIITSVDRIKWFSYPEDDRP